MLEKIRYEKITFPNYLDKLPSVGREREDNFKNLINCFYRRLLER